MAYGDDYIKARNKFECSIVDNRSGKTWCDEEIAILRDGAKSGMTWRDIRYAMAKAGYPRSLAAVRNYARTNHYRSKN